MRKNLMFFVHLFTIAGSVLFSFNSCNNSGFPQVQAAQIPSAPSGSTLYDLDTVKTSDKEFQVVYTATIRGIQDVAIMPQVSGTIEKICVTEGQKVKKGQLLFVIEQVSFQSAVRTAEANVKSAKAQLATAKLNYESNKELFEKNVVSKFTLQTAENSYLSAEAGLAQAEAQAVNAKNSLSYTEIKSPSNGIVGNLPYKVGALVSPQMQEPLTTVSDNSSMNVYFSMTENQLLALAREFGTLDDAIRKMPKIKLQLKDGSVYESEGRIESISGIIDRTTGTVSARAVFPNKAGLLHSGASGTILMPASYDNVIVIPQSAAVRMQDKYLVYKVVDGVAVSTLVQVTNLSDGRDFIVTDGLKVNDVIVAKGAGLLREGTQIIN